MGEDMVQQALDMLDEAESALNAFKLMFKDQIMNLNITVVTALYHASDDFLDVLECGLKAAQTYEETKEFPVEKLMQCPLKLGDKGMEAIPPSSLLSVCHLTCLASVQLQH